MNVESKFQVPIMSGQRKVYTPDQPSASTSEINSTTNVFGVVSYQHIYLTGWRTSSNETNAYPTIHTRLLIALTGDILKENANITEGYSQPELENLSWIQSVRSSLRTQKSVHMAKERTHYVLKSELLREEHLN